LKYSRAGEAAGPVSLGDLDLATIKVTNLAQGVDLGFITFNNVPKFRFSFTYRSEELKDGEWKRDGTDTNDSQASARFSIHVQDAEMATRLAHALSDAARLCHAHEPVKDLY
jgi:hypothetical protein